VIVGIGVDIVDISRFEAALSRTPALAQRLFAESERAAPLPSLAARFAKALGAPPGLRWEDVEVVHDPTGRPALEVRGTVAQAAAQQGVRRWHLSLSHDAGASVAMVVAEA
jgi:holo-[acyl-carrier protein] synthase